MQGFGFRAKGATSLVLAEPLSELRQPWLRQSQHIRREQGPQKNRRGYIHLQTVNRSSSADEYLHKPARKIMDCRAACCLCTVCEAARIPGQVAVMCP